MNNASRGIEILETVMRSKKTRRISQESDDSIEVNIYPEFNSSKRKASKEEGKEWKVNTTLQLDDNNLQEEEELEKMTKTLSKKSEILIAHKNPFYRLSSVINFEKKTKYHEADQHIIQELWEHFDQQVEKGILVDLIHVYF